jgi:ubiquinone/menaquinone biosynthesis C-methylase UbiE
MHHCQSRFAMETETKLDFWAESAHRFEVDPYRTDDVVLNAVQNIIGGSRSVLDVGGGTGRYAIPIALKSRKVTVIDQSPAMLAVLRKQIDSYKIPDITIVHSSFESVSVPVMDVAFCAHVLYTIEKIDKFIELLNLVTSHKVVIIMFGKSPQSELADLWNFIHGEYRITLPGAPELLKILKNMGIKDVSVETIEVAPNYYQSLDEAFKMICQKIFISPDSCKGEKLQQNLDGYLEDCDGKYIVKNAGTRKNSIIYWQKS